MNTKNIKDGQDILREWLAHKLEEADHGIRSRLADHLGVRSEAISRMLKPTKRQGYRVIKADELAKMADFFGEIPPGFNQSLEEEIENLLNLYRAASPKRRAAIVAFFHSLDDEEPEK